MKTSHLLAGLAAALAASAAATGAFAAEGGAPQISGPALAIVSFTTVSSRNPAFDRSAYVYPADNAKKGQVIADAGDVRLDAVVIDGVNYPQAQLQLVSAAKIVRDDGVDPTRGGGNVTTGYGIGADKDGYVGEGRGSTTPTAGNVKDAQANFNLSSIVPVRENPGTTVYEVSFDKPTDTLLLWERGGSGDVLVQAIDARGNIIGSTLVIDGDNDGGKPSSYKPTGIVVTTYVVDGFLNYGQELAAVGLKASQPVTTFRLTAYQEKEGAGAVRYNGPDLKVLALAPKA